MEGAREGCEGHLHRRRRRGRHRCVSAISLPPGASLTLLLAFCRLPATQSSPGRSRRCTRTRRSRSCTAARSCSHRSTPTSSATTSSAKSARAASSSSSATISTSSPSRARRASQRGKARVSRPPTSWYAAHSQRSARRTLTLCLLL